MSTLTTSRVPVQPETSPKPPPAAGVRDCIKCGRPFIATLDSDRRLCSRCESRRLVNKAVGDWLIEESAAAVEALNKCRMIFATERIAVLAFADLVQPIA